MDHAASDSEAAARGQVVPNDVYGPVYGPYEEEDEQREQAKKKRKSKKHKHKKSAREQPKFQSDGHVDNLQRNSEQQQQVQQELRSGDEKGRNAKKKERSSSGHHQDEARKKKKKKRRTPEEEMMRQAARRKRISSKFPDAPIDATHAAYYNNDKSLSSRRQRRSHDPGLPSQSVTPPQRRRTQDDSDGQGGGGSFVASSSTNTPGHHDMTMTRGHLQPQEVAAAFGMTIDDINASLQPVSWDPTFDFQDEVNWESGDGLEWPDDNDVSVITPLTAFADEEPILPGEEEPHQHHVVAEEENDHPFVPVTTTQQFSGRSSLAGGKSMAQWQVSTYNKRGETSRPGAHRVTSKYQAPVSSYSQHYRRTSAPQSRIRSQPTSLLSEKRRNTLPPGLYPIAESFEQHDKKNDKKSENGPLALFPVDESYEGAMTPHSKRKGQQRLSYSSTGDSYAQLETDNVTPGGYYIATRRSGGKGRKSAKEGDEGGGPSYFQSSEQYGDDNLVEDPSAQSARANESGVAGEDRLGAFSVRRMGTLADSELGVLSDQPDFTDHMGHLNRELQNVLYVNADVPEVPEKSPWTYRRLLKPLVALLLLVGIAVAIAVPLVLSSESSDSFSPAVTAARKEQLLVILDGVSDPTALNETSSPQYAACEWVASQDALSPLNAGLLSESETQLILQRYALAVVYYATTGDSWISADGWLDGQREECTWQFLECVNDDVVTMDTGARNNLVGALPAELRELKGLRSLILRSNAISGLPTEIGALENLVELDLSRNSIGGTIPTEIYQLSTLRRLLLRENEFVGTISPLITNISGLKELALDLNAMTGFITTEFLAFSGLTFLDISSNAFSGNFNTMFNGLYQLEALILVNNPISGRLTADMQRFTNLVLLDIAHTEMTGSIPTEMGTLSNLRSLLLEGIGLTGSIPSELGNLRALETAYLDFNMLSGPVPTEMCALPNLEDLRVDCNNECQCDACGDDCRR